MTKLAERAIAEHEKSPATPPQQTQPFRIRIGKYSKPVVYGALSIVLYVLLYKYSGSLVQLAQDTHAGHKNLFFLPIVIAVVFSLVHGMFTAHFWDTLGVKPRPGK